ncbi:response regulator [Paenibacillus tianjinensis]|uniref:Response regulator n=1 Tax=Paenibacillus tianjinensis TaxID=2810347 RepID=A0ABX7L3Y9_9BACL|nr:response regulator [Paenibacillus tianjinensis]QSF42485.1 response regulator [Paenibacillus tianjinensis]
MTEPHLLIADDEAVLRFLISETLENEGYTITEASDGKEAIQVINETSFDLVILDYMMPEVTGIDV